MTNFSEKSQEILLYLKLSRKNCLREVVWRSKSGGVSLFDFIKIE